MADDAVPPNRGEKVWGVTTPLILSPSFELHRLDILPLHRCSRHMHEGKHNAFYVVSGVLYIDSALGERGNFDNHQRINAGDTYTVAPGVDHQFRTGTLPCVALEMYYPNLGGPALAEDIIRRNVGSAL